MNFKLNTSIPNFEQKIEHGNSILFLGSCFSDEVSMCFKNSGFSAISNPFGTIFHPIPLAENIKNCLNSAKNNSIFKKDDFFYSWMHAGFISENSEEKLTKTLAKIQVNFTENLKNTTYLFITFGTSFAYRLKEEKMLVANCHKVEKSKFEKELISVSDLVESWKETLSLIYQTNPKIKIIFTVSPVRHSKDGLKENNRSKARLFELISILEAEFDTLYFPSFEIINDELRDYRFFKDDLVHPSSMAIDYVYEKVKEAFLSEKSDALAIEVENLRKLAAHKVLSKNELEISKFKLERENKIQNFLKENPLVSW
jgi:hypothetical protein